jgi:hypothetical protein
MAILEIAHYKCNDNAANKTVTDTVGSHDGTSVNNTSTMSVSGKINNALEFNGSTDKVTITDHSDFNFTDGAGNDEPFSICFWANTADITRFFPVSKYGTSGNREWWVGTENSDYLVITISDSGNDLLTRTSDAAVTGDEGSWHHYAFTYDGSNSNAGLTIYRDGAVFASTGGSSGIYNGMSSTGTDVSLMWLGASSEYIAGDIDDVRIFDFELTLTQIGLIYNSGSGTEAGLDALETVTGTGALTMPAPLTMSASGTQTINGTGAMTMPAPLEIEADVDYSNEYRMRPVRSPRK